MISTLLFYSDPRNGQEVSIYGAKETLKNRVGSTVHGLYNLVPTTVHTW